MSNIVKFPGHDQDQVPDNVVSFPDARERGATKPVRRGGATPHKTRSFWAVCASSAKVLFRGIRYAAAISVQLALILPLAVISGFQRLICVFSMMALIGTWSVSMVMHGKLSPAELHNVNTIYLVGWGLFILATFAQSLAGWIGEKRIAFRLFGL
ncbi:hypothetical protein QNL75_27010 [Pseudomonas amygdali pv. morsprunorum]|uniref:hypothetical protein n=1 Tax=Pseudomonas amygdali TaxID=47877 RepID=UPI0028922FC5|nr:hypothetical protein [Pseudomonas amygdali]MDT3268709.1 hypothetical protein [Pseudomonas amygdali pv. morsprunorum]